MIVFLVRFFVEHIQKQISKPLFNQSNVMLRRTISRYDFNYFGRTKFGAEALRKTKGDMQTIDRSPNPILRYLSRKRNVDQLQILVEGRITDELHPFFKYATNFFTLLVTLPVLGGLVTGKLMPSYYVLVSTGLIHEEKYFRMWKLANMWVVLAGQLFIFVVYYDLSIYLRMPFFAYVLAPSFRKFGWLRPPPIGAMTTEELLAKSPQGKMAKKIPVSGKPKGFGWRQSN